jgi:hypothetical protein
LPRPPLSCATRSATQLVEACVAGNALGARELSWCCPLPS